MMKICKNCIHFKDGMGSFGKCSKNDIGVDKYNYCESYENV